MSKDDFLKFNNGKQIFFEMFNKELSQKDIKDERLKELFNIFDKDKSGKLDKSIALELLLLKINNE